MGEGDGVLSKGLLFSVGLLAFLYAQIQAAAAGVLGGLATPIVGAALLAAGLLAWPRKMAGGLQGIMGMAIALSALGAGVGLLLTTLGQSVGTQLTGFAAPLAATAIAVSLVGSLAAKRLGVKL